MNETSMKIGKCETTKFNGRDVAGLYRKNVYVATMLLGCSVVAPGAWAAAHFQSLTSFGSAGTVGQKPYVGLVQGNDGALYGTTLQGGSNNMGTVFKVTRSGGYTALHEFSTNGDGQSPMALVQGTDGSLYGTTSIGGSNKNGTVFKMNKNGTGYTLLHQFGTTVSDGQNAQAGLVQGSDGALYGTTFFGGSNDLGTAFKVNTNGTGYSVLHHFSASDNDGQNPASALMEGSDKTLYGTTQFGGSNNLGTVFKLNKNGSGFAVLRSFAGNLADGSSPSGALIQGKDGALYGTTYSGGNSNVGTVFKLNRDGSGYGVMHSFLTADGANPFAGVLEGMDGALYGATYSGGSHQMGALFTLNKDGSNYSVLLSFESTGTSGQNPRPALALGLDGAFYGTTWSGGQMGLGTVFQLLPPQTPDMLDVANTAQGMQVRFAGVSGSHYQVFRTTDFVNWVALDTITMPASGIFPFVDSAAPSLAGNYRAAWIP